MTKKCESFVKINWSSCVKKKFKIIDLIIRGTRNIDQRRRLQEDWPDNANPRYDRIPEKEKKIIHKLKVMLAWSKLNTYGRI